MSIFKKLSELINKKDRTDIVSVATEDLGERLKEFENIALQEKLKTLEKVITFLAQKVEIQSEVIRRQGETLKHMHTSIEEIANIIETFQQLHNGNVKHIEDDDDSDDDLDSTTGKKFFN